MTDIAEQLRNLNPWKDSRWPEVLREGADEIERLRERSADWCAAMTENHDLWREVERMRAALSEIVEECHNTGYGDPTVMERMIDRIEETASAAMRERQND